MSAITAGISRGDVYGLVILAWISTFGLTMFLAARKQLPTLAAIQDFSSIFNTKGGIIMLLTSLWILTLTLQVGLGVWVIIRGVDPQHTVVTVLFAMLSGQAFGNVNGALFKRMTGEEPSRSSSTYTGPAPPPVPQPAPPKATAAP